MTEEEIYIEESIAYLPGSAAAVYFAPSKMSLTGDGFLKSKGTAPAIRQLVTALEIVPWGEDNRFPQNIVKLMDYYGSGKEWLNYKANYIWGGGLIPGKITGYESGGATEIFTPLDIAKYKPVYDFINSCDLAQFYLEFLLDWVWFGNCFPELIFSNDGKTIAGLVHQESCDCRYKQMNSQAEIDTVYISKIWGMANDQFVKFDPKKRIVGLVENPSTINNIDPKFISVVDCADPYDKLNSIKKSADKQKDKPAGALKSCILPVYYPSPNKTYYQLVNWDGARLAGWIEIAIKIPSIIKSLYNNSLILKYHVEMPEAVLWDAAGGKEVWLSYKGAEGQVKKKAVKKKVLQDLDNFLRGDENAGKTFVSFFGVDQVKGEELGRVKITAVEDKMQLDKEMLASATANSEFLYSIGINPDEIGAGVPGGAYGGNKGGSNIREASIVRGGSLTLLRQVILAPLYAIRDYNREVGKVAEWENDIIFKFRDTILTTLDQNTGSVKKVS